MAGERGPDLKELVRPADHGYGLVSPAGEVMEATGGKRGLGVEPEPPSWGEVWDLELEKVRSR